MGEDNIIELTNEGKSATQSKTIVAAGVTVVVSLLGVFGYTVTDADQGAIVLIITSLTAAVGGLAAIYGRIKASKPITSVAAPAPAAK